MANQEHLLAVTQGPDVFAQWRSENPTIALELEEADLAGVDLRGAKVRNANLRGANLAGAILSKTSFARADLSGANLTGAEMARCVMSAATCRGTDLTNVNLYWADLKQINRPSRDILRLQEYSDFCSTPFFLTLWIKTH